MDCEPLMVDYTEEHFTWSNGLSVTVGLIWGLKANFLVSEILAKENTSFAFCIGLSDF